MKYPDWFVPFTQPAPFKSIDGGRSSGKTTQVADYLIVEAATKYINCACVREFQKSIRESAKAALENAIHRLGVRHKFIIKANEILCPSTGSRFFFQGHRTEHEQRARDGKASTVCGSRKRSR